MANCTNPGGHSNTTDKSAPEASSSTYKQCRECLANIPMSYFGIAKQNPDGRRETCKECRNQINSVYWEEKWGRNNPRKDPILAIRSVSIHNKKVVAELLKHNVYTFFAIRPQDKTEYKALFKPSKETGLPCLSLYSRDGSFVREFSFSGNISDIQNEILAFVKIYGIRLELTETDLQTSKTVIYYI